MSILEAIGDALRTAFEMGWEILWPLILGFTLSGVVQAVVSHRSLARLLGDDRPRSLCLASLFGMASSSCSYASVALARSIFRKGASFTAAMVFELASTNLVIELGIILIVLLGWQFAAAEFIGGSVMIVVLALLLRATLSQWLLDSARQNAELGRSGRMEGHAEMDMSITEGPLLQRVTSPRGFTAISHFFVMDWVSVWMDIVAGLLIAGALAAWVPDAFWRDFFLVGDPTWAKVEGPLVGPLVAVISFVCSVGNVPLAAVLWQNGISFGGVVSFLFADLIVLPILDIYRRYYGWRVAAYLTIALYITMVLGGYFVEIVFGAADIIPSDRSLTIVTEGVKLNYTTILNIVFLLLAALLVWRFLVTGGPAMLRQMGAPRDASAAAMHDGHHTVEDSMNENETTYTCPMHPDVRSPLPGTCPKCGMKLEPHKGADERAVRH